jgi:hypothetical protein
VDSSADLPVLLAASLVVSGASLLTAWGNGSNRPSIDLLMPALQRWSFELSTAVATISPYVYVAGALLLAVIVLVSDSDRELA